MNESVIIPEMLEAGKAALTEGRKRDLSDLQILIDVYLAMQGQKIIMELQRKHGVVFH